MQDKHFFWKYRLPKVDQLANIWCISCSPVNLVVNRGCFETTWTGMVFPAVGIECYMTKWPCNVKWGLDSSISRVFCLFIVVLCIEFQIKIKIPDIEYINELKTIELVIVLFYFSFVIKINCISLKWFEPKSFNLEFPTYLASRVLHLFKLSAVILCQVNIFIPFSFLGVEIPFWTHASHIIASRA